MDFIKDLIGKIESISEAPKPCLRLMYGSIKADISPLPAPASEDAPDDSEDSGVFRRIKGYASVFGNVDHHGDRVIKGAFANSIAKRGQRLPIFVEHSHLYGPYLPVGHTTVLREDDHGLYFEGDLVDTRDGEDLAKLLDAGSINEGSFAYDVIRASDAADGFRDLTELDISEVSVVTWGANSETRIEAVSFFENSLALVNGLNHLNAAIAAKVRR